MSSAVMVAKGCIVRVNLPMGGSLRGFYDIAPSLSTNGRSDSVVLIQGVSPTGSDIVQFGIGLDGYKYLPVFGKNFATVRIDGLVLCGKSGGLAEGIRHVNAWFEANRVTRRMRGVNVSMAMSGAMRVIITRLVWGGDDTQVNEKPFSIEGVTADL